MSRLSERITSELQALIGRPLSGCWRAANMQVFEFGSQERHLNREGESIDHGLRLHVQCRWRMVDGERIIWARDDLLRPADPSASIDGFDWDKDDSVLDVVQRAWFDDHRAAPVTVELVSADAYGGCRIDFENRVTLELFPCDSDRSEYSEHWRLCGHRPDGSHFVVTGHGIAGDQASSNDG